MGRPELDRSGIAVGIRSDRFRIRSDRRRRAGPDLGGSRPSRPLPPPAIPSPATRCKSRESALSPTDNHSGANAEESSPAPSMTASPASSTPASPTPTPASPTSSPASPAAAAPPGPPPLTPADQLLMLASGAWVTQMIHVAAELAVADQLAAGERSAEELAAACGADADSLFRLLRGLASLGIFLETAPRHFALTPLAEPLRSDHPQSLRQFARMLGAEHYLSWDDLLHSIRTGENAFRHRYGMGIFAWYQQNPARGAIFDAAMGDYSRRETEGVLAAYDFSAIQHLVDVGGGQGTLLHRVLGAFPQLRGTVLDQPSVVAGAVVPPELEGRLALQGGDFFAEAPAGADAYLLKHILHDWGDEACLTILGRIRAAMAPGGRVLIVEQVIPPGNDPFPGKLLDLNMLVMTEGGRERTPGEYAALLESAGLRLQRIVPTPSPVSVVEAVAG